MTEIVWCVPNFSKGRRKEVIDKIAAEVEMLYCANIRSGWSFAVADAYKRWTDVAEEEVRAMLATPPPS